MQAGRGAGRDDVREERVVRGDPARGAGADGLELDPCRFHHERRPAQALRQSRATAVQNRPGAKTDIINVADRRSNDE